MQLQRSQQYGHPVQEHSFDHRGFDGIKMIEIGCGEWIDNFRVQYVKDGNLIWTPQVGGHGGDVHRVRFYFIYHSCFILVEILTNFSIFYRSSSEMENTSLELRENIHVIIITS